MKYTSHKDFLFISFLNVEKNSQMTDAILLVFQIYTYEQTTAEMNDQLTTIQTNCNQLEEEVHRKLKSRC